MRILQPVTRNDTIKATFFWMGLTFLFIMVMGGFSPQYDGNQTTKFLFGFADAGIGYLDQDFEANTIDPLPVFSWIIQFTYKYLGEWVLFVYVFILVGIYLYSLVMILDHFFQIRASGMLFFMVVTVLMLTYSNLWPFPVNDLLNDGVATQDMTLTRFLPNGFAIFSVLSILLFLKKRPYWAVAAVAVACNVHTGYMIIGAALVSAYLVIDFWENRDVKRVVLIGGLALLLVLPMVVMYVTANQNATAAQFAEANHIVANIRIPQHTLVSVWWGESALIKFFLVLAAIVVMRRTKMFPILLIGLVVVYGTALALYIRPSNKIAVLQIWRMSVMLIPLSSALLIGALISGIFNRFKVMLQQGRWVVILVLSGLMLAVLVFGIQRSFERWSALDEAPGSGLMTYVADTGGPDEVYLIPPKDDYLTSFRLRTGQPILVDWKSHPWNAVELLEWYRRMGVAEEFYDAAAEDRCGMLADLRGVESLTHIVLSALEELDCDAPELIFADQNYRLYMIQP